MEILDGKKTAQALKGHIATEVAQWVAQGNKRPHLAAILVGTDGASQTYVGHKERDCKEAGIESTVIRLDDTIGEEALLQTIEGINQNADIDGLIVQLPL
ncbi:MAG: bifunctional 5,10-methylene-tetrahydrofolate dehydrogenase/5,10-methylene-tetrahydrofolate cyclohydrolase, partial [Bacteroidetes bacterium]|nr:bifunctional 5,10-methylene-tetrahydrofolate dehydrogenase/5,10-methylene-tetrahydrofolate cyclohydrolase [Bacteroidota bacterium]